LLNIKKALTEYADLLYYLSVCSRNKLQLTNEHVSMV